VTDQVSHPYKTRLYIKRTTNMHVPAGGRSNKKYSRIFSGLLYRGEKNIWFSQFEKKFWIINMSIVTKCCG
jgi:hypothetical protein